MKSWSGMRAKATRHPNHSHPCVSTGRKPGTLVARSVLKKNSACAQSSRSSKTTPTAQGHRRPVSSGATPGPNRSSGKRKDFIVLWKGSRPDVCLRLILADVR